MDGRLSENESSAYLQSLMEAGQRSAQQFDDTLAQAIGVSDQNNMSTNATLLPLRLALEITANISQALIGFGLKRLFRCLRWAFNLPLKPVRTDKRFKDEAWQATPYFDLLKQRPRRWRHQSTGQKKAQSLAE